MRKYKLEIKEKLIETGWELEEIDTETDWWLEEVWTIVSTKQNWGYRLYIHFLVDLQYEGTNKSSAVWCVSAIENKAENYHTAQSGFADMLLQRGKFDENIKLFIGNINKQRDLQSL